MIEVNVDGTWVRVDFFTSDLHLGHRNISKFCNRPAWAASGRNVDTVVDLMHQDIAENWNSTVGPDDIVMNLGDTLMGDWENSAAFLRSLNGQFILLAGNHDKHWAGNREQRPTFNYEAWETKTKDRTGALWVGQAIDARIDGGPVLHISHFPMFDKTMALHEGKGGVDRFGKFRPEVGEGEWLLCGHIHEMFLQRGRQINVGIDAWGGMPVPAAQVIELINAGPADKGAIRW